MFEKLNISYFVINMDKMSRLSTSTMSEVPLLLLSTLSHRLVQTTSSFQRHSKCLWEFSYLLPEFEMEQFFLVLLCYKSFVYQLWEKLSNLSLSLLTLFFNLEHPSFKLMIWLGRSDKEEKCVGARFSKGESSPATRFHASKWKVHSKKQKRKWKWKVCVPKFKLKENCVGARFWKGKPPPATRFHARKWKGL